MSLLQLLLVVLALPAFAQDDYLLVQFKNDRYRTFTFEELIADLGPSRELISSYACDGKKEFDPYAAPELRNEKRDSLLIKAYESSGVAVYRNGKLYDSAGNEDLSSDKFYKHIRNFMGQLEQIPEVAQIIRHLESSAYPVTMAFHGSGAFFFRDPGETTIHTAFKPAQAISILLTKETEDSPKLTFTKIGAGGMLYWNPKGDVPLATLAHELYHAFDSIRGLIDFRMVLDKNFTFLNDQGPDKSVEYIFEPHEDNLKKIVNTKYEFQKVSEYRAVYLENLVRKRTGLPYRQYYGNVTTGPDMLDDNGEPIFMPAPCL